MDTGLATAGAVIGTILALLKQLQTFEQDLDSDNGDLAQLNHVVQTLGLQRSTFEDTILELLYDVLPSADVSAFFRAPEDARWREAPVQAKANARLGELAKGYWQTCALIQEILLDIKRDADNVLVQKQVKSYQQSYSHSLERKRVIRSLWEGKNINVLMDLEKKNVELKMILNQLHQERDLRIQKAKTDLRLITSLITPQMSAETIEHLEEICVRVQQDEENPLRELGLGDAPERPSFRYCSSKNAICHAGSTIPYDTLARLRLRWALVHLTATAGFEPQKCCWSNCPSTEPFSHLAEFLAHFSKCEYSNSTEYHCLLSLERAWYDNRCAWLIESMLSSENNVRNKPELTWPSKYQKFQRKQRVPLEPYEKWTKIDTGNATIDAVRYGGVLLVRKMMNWQTQPELDDYQKESEHLQRLTHFHIIQLFGSYIQSDFYAILLYPLCEYTLSDFMKNNCQADDTEEILSDLDLRLDRLYLESFFPCLAQGLKFIHNNTTRHMDIKASNILVKERLSGVDDGRRYHIYIADFGTSSTFTSVSQTAGYTGKTLKYCAPEVAPTYLSAAATGYKKWGRPADVFSLGCVYAEMLTVLACNKVATFDAFRAGKITLDKQELPQERGQTFDGSFHANLARVGEWLQSLHSFQDADQQPQHRTRGYWYRRGDRLAFAPWKNTFAETINIAGSMLAEQQEDRPRIAEVLKRFDVDECCNREIIPLFDASC